MDLKAGSGSPVKTLRRVEEVPPDTRDRLLQMRNDLSTEEQISSINNDELNDALAQAMERGDQNAYNTLQNYKERRNRGEQISSEDGQAVLDLVSDLVYGGQHLIDAAIRKAAPVQTRLNEIMDNAVLGQLGNIVGRIGLAKTAQSIASKIARTGSNALMLNDLARGCFYISRYESLPDTVQGVLDLLQQNGAQITKVKDFFAEPNQWGYRGVHINALIDGVGCEIQFASEDVWWKVKEKSEKLYAKWRDFDFATASPEDLAAYNSDILNSNKMWEDAAAAYAFPAAVNLVKSDSVTMWPSQMSEPKIGADGLAQEPSRNSATPSLDTRTSRPSSSSDTSGTNLRSIETPPNDTNMPQDGENVNGTNSPPPGASALSDKPLGIIDTDFRDTVDGIRKFGRKILRSVVSGQAETERTGGYINRHIGSC